MSVELSPRLRAVTLLALVGGVGMVGGILIDRLWLAEAGQGGDPQSGPSAPVAVIRSQGEGPPARGVRIVRLGLPEQLAEDLQLSEGQKAEIERIVAEHQEELRATMAEFEPSFQDIVRRSRERIEEVLNEEQAARWRESAVLRIRGPAPDGEP
jgi:hypothetical protein